MRDCLTMVLDAALAVPQDLFIFIGVCEFLGGAGLIVPAFPFR